ncbi:type II toxin-antitoxin system PemK/MazF family toxin [Bradyrhizobium sp. CB1650]|uniref:type II toxin-antitoxin system PemK/MazF family toxin n=1 Tax=Bradyrhizobium sp. CB1650 TaxID=3039153 RepID=UPI0024355736|nr:type II toxin-antitoxin system PemK/MazF family toxin [Bradyrhizobium sp. CB1650]WGD51453.1 type II toxin-antitoxin system PemK/MazF family toxin [Bradyrhizobium sp. CB1650]
MPPFRQGDVVRVPFPYTDRSTRQHRPALVVSTGGIGENENLIWVVMITSAENRTWPGDLAIGRYEEAGLPAPSIIRSCKIATIEARHAERLGRIKPRLTTEVVSAIRSILGS